MPKQMNAKLPKTKKLIKEFENSEWDYDKSILKQIKICKSVLAESRNSGFSASCVTSSLIRTTHLSGDEPGIILNLSDFLYPQYDLVEKIKQKILENRKWYVKNAKKRLKERDNRAA